MNLHTILLSIAVAGFLLTACDSSINSQKEGEAPISVTVGRTVQNGNHTFITTSGTVRAVNSTQLSTRTTGYITQVTIQVGERVEKGRLLVAINNADIQAKSAQVRASVAEAEVAMENALREYNRFQNLFNDNSASQKELDDRTTQYELSKARFEAAKELQNEVRAQFAYTNITAPFTGVVTSVTAQEGDLATPGKPLMSIETTGNFEVVTQVPEAAISEIKLGKQATVAVRALDTILSGKVTEVSPSATTTGGQYLVTVTLEDTDVALFSGMFASVQFPNGEEKNLETVLIPQSALVSRGQLTGVYTLGQNNTALLRWVRLGKSYGANVEVLSGLSENETYILTATGKLYDGAPISVQ